MWFFMSRFQNPQKIPQNIVKNVKNALFSDFYDFNVDSDFSFVGFVTKKYVETRNLMHLDLQKIFFFKNVIFHIRIPWSAKIYLKKRKKSNFFRFSCFYCWIRIFNCRFCDKKLCGNQGCDTFREAKKFFCKKCDFSCQDSTIPKNLVKTIQNPFFWILIILVSIQNFQLWVLGCKIFRSSGK